MKKLKEGNYDLLLADPVKAGSDLVADILGIPLVLSFRSSPVNNWERHCGQMPAPPSFVPGAMSKLTDKMDFSENIVIDHTFWNVLDRYYSDVKGTPTSACEPAKPLPEVRTLNYYHLINHYITEYSCQEQ
uniref:Uncharacterized protein n=1 Tax=Pundamilia nyererei TaxID=303518 RepID=A0A3B4ETQ0_9CICH